MTRRCLFAAALAAVVIFVFAAKAACAGNEPPLQGQAEKTPDNALGLSRSLRDKFEETGIDLQLLCAVLEAYYTEHASLPAHVSDLTSPVKYLPGGIVDPFAPKLLGIIGRQLKIGFSPDGKSAVIYSVGPDGDWDGGKRIDPADPSLDGDIIMRYDAPTRRQLPENDEIINKYLGLTPIDEAEKRKADNKHLAEALLELKRKDGRENAMLHYCAAATLMPKTFTKDQGDSIAQVLRQGWGPQASSLLPLLAAFEPMFQEIRKGVELDYFRNIGCTKGVLTPIPDFVAAQVGAKMLCFEGLYLEQQSKYDDALNNYLTVLTMGRDYGTSGATTIGETVSVSIQSIALNRIHPLVASSYLDRPALERLLPRLKEIEKTCGSVVEAIHVENEMYLEHWRATRAKMLESAARGQTPINVSLKASNAFIDQLEADQKRVWGILFRQMETPYWKRDQAACDREIEIALATCNPLTKSFLPNYSEPDARYGVMATKMLETQIATALALHKIEKGKYPQHLSELVPAYFSAVPTDPFSGEALRYSCVPDGSRYALYGVGPDKKDDRGALRYDPANGTISAGDIFFREAVED